jgi:D-glycero-beta-D-manno-heptose-7-phosphate kinase
MNAAASRVEPRRLHALLEGFPRVTVLVLADLVLDEFRYGETSRISREAPVLILNHRRTDLLPGGGANAVANLKSLGARPVIVGRLGDDPSGDTLLALFARRGISTSLIWTHQDFHTPTKTRILAGGAHSVKQQVVRIDQGEPLSLTPGEEEILIKNLRRGAAGAAGLLISDYGYGLVHPGNAPAILEAAREAKLEVVVDSRSQIPIYRGITAAAPNLEEAEAAAGISVGKDSRLLEQLGARLREITGARAVMVTLGSRGLALFAEEEEPVHLPVFGTDEVADVTGAGDTVAAAFTLARLAGGTFLEAATLANIAAGLVVMKRGTATVTPEELRRAVDTLPREAGGTSG